MKTTYKCIENSDKTVLYTNKKSRVNIEMNEKKIELVNECKYLGFTWTNKLSLKSTIDRCIGNIQRSLGELRWLRTRWYISTKAFRQCFFAYIFPQFGWLFPFFPVLPESQQQLLQQEFRVSLWLVLMNTHWIFTLNNTFKEDFKKIYTTDLGRSPFYNDIFLWDEFHKRKNDHLSQFFRSNRV